ncbi:MAG: ribbon-helix-helix domain-containing protein [Desulfobacterales bacterium]|nr:MAG: ribbon-helix-helix domain-containing protein [Desulfobacterales bacterium]
MIRTQIYLTEEEMAALKSLSSQTAKKQSELIREAVDDFITKFSNSRREDILDKVAGIWKHRNDLPDFDKLRKEWDRLNI